MLVLSLRSHKKIHVVNFHDIPPSPHPALSSQTLQPRLHQCRHAKKTLSSGSEFSGLTGIFSWLAAVFRQLVDSFESYKSVHWVGKFRDGHATALFDELRYRLVLASSDADELSSVVNHSSQLSLWLQRLHAVNCILATCNMYYYRAVSS